MCGIVASLGLRLKRGRSLDRALASLAHRGPDGEGSWRSADGLLALGHRRLAVVGGPSATQPVSSPPHAAVLNGQLYGWRSQAAALGVSETLGDGGLLPALYARHGTAMGAQLRGEFALVVADTRHRRLLALRDPYGTKPLYWAHIGEGIALASEIKALFALGLPPRLSHRALVHAFAHQYLPPGLSMVAGVGLLPPGGRLVAQVGPAGLSVCVDRWTTRDWPLELQTQAGGLSERPAHAELVEALDDAVAVRLDAERPVGALLSGGLDSAAIVDAAVRQAGPLPCFTLRFPGADYDEGAAAADFAAARGCPLHAVSVSHADLLTHLPEAVAAAEGLCINGQLVARRLLARRVRQAGVVVVLSGEGSDEVALGYPHLALDAGAAPSGVVARHGAQAGVMLPPEGGGAVGVLDRTLGFTPSFVAAKADFGRRLLALTEPGFSSACPAPLSVLGASLAELPLSGRHPAHQASALWMELCLAGYILRGISDAQDMAEGVENRPPFLDPKVWAVTRRVPASAQLRSGETKAFLRAALAERLGPVAARPKHPFLAPPLLGALGGADRGRARLLAQVHGTLDGLAAVPGVSLPRVRTWLRASLQPLPAAETSARDAVLWTLLSTATLSQHLRSAA